MAYESRQSSRRTSKRPRSYGTEDIPAASLIPFPSGKKSFFSELVKFHTDKGTGLPRFPTISGVFVDLFELYCAVVNRGGYNRATSFDCWKEIAEAIGLSHCTNLTVGLRQIYARYLAHYESLTIALDDDDFHDFDDLHMEPGSNSILRKKTMPTITVSNIPVPMTYNHDQQNKHSKSNARTNSPQLCGHSYLDKMYLGLLSGFPNEQKFLLDTCMLLSFEPTHAHAMCTHHHLLNAILAQVGVLPDDSTFISLYRDWFTKVSNCSFIQFWIESVQNELVLSYIMRNSVFRNYVLQKWESKNESHFTAFDCNCNEYRKVALTLYLLRHLSFETRNQDALAENKAVKEILLMCVGNKIAKLRVLALDAIANMSSYLNLSQDCLNDLIFKLILSLLNSPDSIERIRSMEILGGMSQMQSHALVIEKLQVSVYEQIVAMLTVQDLLVLLSCVGLLYQLTYTGPEACECLVKVQFVVEQLTALITFDVQSMGLEALTSVKVIEQPKSILGRAHQSSHSTYNPGNGVDVERPIVKWLLGTYDIMSEDAVGVFSNDVFRDFKKSTVFASIKASQISLVTFNRCLKIAFPAAPAKVVDSLDGSIYFTGICKRGSVAKYSKNIPSSSQGRASSHLAKSSSTVGGNAVNNLPGGMMNHTNKPFPIKPQASYATTKQPSHNKKLHETPKFSSVESSSKNVSTAPSSRTVVAAKVSVDNKNSSHTNATSINQAHVGQHFANKPQNVLPAAVSAMPVQVSNTGSAVCNSNSSTPVQQQQQPILVQLMLPGSGESAFKKPTEANKGHMSATAIVNDMSKSKSNHPATTPALFVGSVSGNQLIFSAVQGNNPAPQQTSLIKAVMKPVNDGSNSATSSNTPPSIVLGHEAANTLAHTRAIPSVIHQPPVGRNSNSSSKTISATQGGANLMGSTNVITNTSLAAASFQGAQSQQQSHNATIVPNVVKPKPISNSVAPPITTNMHGKHPNIASYMNGNCNISKTVNGDFYISEVSNSSLPSSPASNFDNSVKPPAPPVNIAAAATKSGNGSTAYQNGLINSAGNIVNNKCEIVNGVAYKIVNSECIKSNIPSVTPSNDSQLPPQQPQQKILYAVPQQSLASVKPQQPVPPASAPHLVVNGEANEPILDIESIKTLVSRAQVDIKQTLDHAANCVIANNNVMTDNGNINATNMVPIVTNSKNRKRRSSNDPDAANGHNNGQIFVTPINSSNNGGGGNGLSGFKKVKVNDMSSARLPPVARDNSEAMASNGVVTSNLQQSQQNSPSVSKKDSYSCIPSLHAAVNSVIAASADGKLVTGNSQLSLVPSSTSSNTTKVIIQPVSVAPSSPHTFRANIPQPAPLVASAAPVTTAGSSPTVNTKRLMQPFVPAVVQQPQTAQAQSARSSSNNNKVETVSEAATQPEMAARPDVTATQHNAETTEIKPSPQNNSNSLLVYKCEWENCTSRFEKWQHVFHHCCRVHCNVGLDGAEVCKWRSCDGLRRKKFSLYTHLQEKHCSEALLEKAKFSSNAASCSSSLNSATSAVTNPNKHATPSSSSCSSSTATPSASSSNSAASSSTNPESLYSMHTLHYALQRSGWVPPSKDTSLSVIEKEGPVSKAVRLNAALVLRNLAQHSAEGRRLIRLQERKLILAATSCIEASPFLASCLLNLCNL